MKGKKIALLIAALSVASAFSACDGGACTKHTDSDKNLVCDNCQKAIVYVTEYLPAETEPEVPMVVNPLPTENNRADFFTTEAVKPVLNKAEFVTEGEKLEATETAGGWWYAKSVIVDETENTQKSVCKWWTKDGKLAFSWESDVFAQGEVSKKQLEFSFRNGLAYFCVSEPAKDENDQDVTKRTVKIYTYNGDLVFEDSGIDVVFSTDTNTQPVYGVTYKQLVAYGVTFAMDATTNALLYVFDDAETVIYRPEYTVNTGSYGALIKDDTLWVHKLDGEKWIDLAYTKVIPSYWQNVQLFALEDGNILMQGYCALPADAVNYDINLGAKYDVFQTVINPATGEETQLEFGYIIKYMVTATPEEGFTEKAKNLAVISPIVNKAVSTEELEVILDNQLNILYVEQTSLLGQGDIQKQVAEDLYLSTLTYDNGSTVRILVNGKGELVEYIPEIYEDKGSYLQAGSKLYAWTDLKNAKFDLEGYSVITMNGNYFMLRKEIQPTDPEGEVTYETYYLNVRTLAAPVKVNGTLNTTMNDYIITMVTVPAQGETPETVKYCLYNSEYQLFGEYEVRPTLSFGVNGVTVKVNGVTVAVKWN